MADLLADLGIDQASYDENSGSTVTEAFQLLESGAYPATVEEVVLYKDSFGGTNLKITVLTKEDERKITFRKDVGKTLKDGKINEGFVARLKSLCEAANVDVNSLTTGDSVKVNSFGKECDGQLLLGLNGKNVLALVRMSVDSNKAEGESYRESNDLEGLTSSGSEDADKFAAKIEKNKGTFTYKGWKKSGGSDNKPASNEDKQALKDLDF